MTTSVRGHTVALTCAVLAVAGCGGDGAPAAAPVPASGLPSASSPSTGLATAGGAARPSAAASTPPPTSSAAAPAPGPAGLSTPADALRGSAVLSGLVQEGERCPHQSSPPDPACAPVPLPDVRVTVSGSGSRSEAVSGPDGRFRLTLAPGLYHVTGERLERFQIVPEQDVEVVADRAATVVLTYGNGIQ